jgi:hypothetical protein
MEGFRMKRFSWIFALIMALSIGFIGCPTGGDDDGGGSSGSTGGGGNGIPFALGDADGKAQLYWNSNNSEVGGDGNHSPGTLVIIDGGRGYRYTYGDGPATASENVIIRFKYDLGAEMSLDDYGCVTFKWDATQPDGYKSDINSNKRLYLLASKTEEDLIGYKTREALSPFVISPYDSAENWYAGAQGDAGAPIVNGNGEVTVTLPVSSSFMGEVWFAIYVHGNSGAGTYTIRDFYFGGDPTASTQYNPDAPTPVVIEPDGVADTFDMDLSQFVTTNVFNSAVTPTVSGGTLTANFTANNERLVIAFTAAQYNALQSRINSKLHVKIEGTATSTADPTGDAFRYHIGDAVATGNWNATSGAGGGALFASILEADLTWESNTEKTNNGELSSLPKHFILQHQNASAVQVAITKITITVYQADSTPAFFKTAAGLNGDKVGVFGGGDTHKFAHTVLTVKGGDGGFSVNFPEGFTRFDTLNIQYACMVDGSTAPQFVSKQGFTSGWIVEDVDDVNANLYPTLNIAAVGTLSVKGYNAAGVSAGKAYFQNNDNVESRIKIISVTKTAGEITEFDPVTNLTIGGLTPVKNSAPVATIDNAQYSGTIVWTETDGGAAVGAKFGMETEYTATITLTAKGAFTFNGVDADAFTVTGADETTNPAGTGSGAGTTLVVTAEFPETEGAPLPGIVVWEPTITASTTMNGSGEYIGNTGIQRGAGAAELTLTPIEGGFTATVVSGNYKQINIQVGTAAGGTNYYTSDGFVAETGTNYKITFKASVSTGTGQFRAGANNNALNWDGDFALTTTPAEFEYEWTQGSGNFKFDTGNTAVDTAIIITDIKIVTN